MLLIVGVGVATTFIILSKNSSGEVIADSGVDKQFDKGNESKNKDSGKKEISGGTTVKNQDETSRTEVEENKDKAETKKKDAIYYTITPVITVNFADESGRTRYMQIDVAVLVRDESISEAVAQHKPVVNAIVASEVVVTSVFKVNLDGCEGYFHITLPYTMLQPIKEKLDAQLKKNGSGVDDRWQESMRVEIMNTLINLSSSLVETEIPLGDIINLTAGDIIPVDIPEHVTVFADGVPVLKGKFGIS